jgi:serine/threonine protein kinase
MTQTISRRFDEEHTERIVRTSASGVGRVAERRGTELRSRACYLDLGKIASGATASVHFARLTSHGGFARAVVVRRLHAHLASNREFVALLLDQARLSARIMHANVVPTLDVAVDRGNVCVIMEYVRGLPLSHLFEILRARREPVPAPIASGIAVGVLNGLHAAHEAMDECGAPLEIVHGDLSPQKILVGVDGVARLLDFGVANGASQLEMTLTGTLSGREAYMSPERVLRGQVERGSDVYSVGVVLREAASRERVSRDGDDAPTLEHVLGADARSPGTVRGLPPGIADVVDRATALAARDRYPTAREMAVDLERHTEVASATEIAEWVSEVGRDSLLAIAQRIAWLESAALDLESTGDSVTAPSVRDTQVSGDSSASPGTPREGSSVAPVSAPTRAPSSEADSSLSSTLSGAHAKIPSRPAGAPTARSGAGGEPLATYAVMFLAVVAATVILIVIMIAHRASHGRAAASTKTAVAARAATVSVSAPGPVLLPSDTGEPSRTPLRTASADSPAPAPPSRPRASQAKCVPSSVDSVGHTHYNLACL